MSAVDRPTAVIGAGTLGRRIALMLATQGAEVRIFDTSAEQQAAAVEFVEAELPKLLKNRADGSSGQVGADGSLGQVAGADGSPGQVVGAGGLAEAVADAWLVIEALPERLDLKQQVFGELDQLAPDDAILATNSSSYPSSHLIDDVSRPERVVNTHFYMPPFRNAVEVMSSGRTDRQVIDLLMERFPAFGLVPFEVRQESVGFIFNRIWAAIKRESLAVVADGVATPQEVDRIFQISLGAPYGPFRAMDVVGLDVVLDIEEHYAALHDDIPEAPRRLLRDYLEHGHLGMKSGRGFYDDYSGAAAGRGEEADAPASAE